MARGGSMQSLGKPDRTGIVIITQAIFHQQPTEVVQAHDRPEYPLWQSETYQIAKRCLDICVALIGLALLVLPLPILGLLIFLEDHHAIFYKQQRVGLHGRLFTVYKLRTMVADADGYLTQHPELQAAWKRKGKLSYDPRITRIGRFLRRTSLDELPQLFNVLRGEMTLVGPRAIQSSELAAFGELSQLRQQVKPGLTGLWQISGRSSTTYQQRCVLDCIYVIECSLWADVRILIKTIPAVLCARGAC
jgi:lipopolysaccharide/colanic/teichoic acid biosynthesis glycosyltransferase